MIYDFWCKNESCDKFEEEISFEASINIGPPINEVCKCCNQPLARIFSWSVHIPEHLKATADIAANYDDIKYKMARSRPSGKDRVIY